MRAYCIGKNAGSLILIVSFVLSASAYGQTPTIAAKDCSDAAGVLLDCGSPSRVDPASSTGKEGVSNSSNDRRANSLPGKNAEQDSPPSASVNKLDSDLPSPAALKTKTHHDVYSRPSTSNNSYKSDQTKDERGRTVMGH